MIIVDGNGAHIIEQTNAGVDFGMGENETVVHDSGSAPKRVRRTREQIEQEKIEKAQQRIETIKAEQRLRKVAIACGKVEEAMHLLAGTGCCVELPNDDGTDSDHETVNVLLAIRTALSLELGE